MGDNLLGIFCLVDNKGAIHMPKLGPVGWGGAYDPGFKVFNEEVGYQRVYGSAHMSTMYLLIIFILECEKVHFRQNSRRVIMLWMEREILMWSSGSCQSLLQIMSRV